MTPNERPGSEPVHRLSTLCLDAESVRDELVDARTNSDQYQDLSDSAVQQILALSDNEINQAIHAATDDAFWAAYDAVRTTVLHRLINAYEE